MKKQSNAQAPAPFEDQPVASTSAIAELNGPNSTSDARPAKRPKASKISGVERVQSKKRKGRLSALPGLPLDVLYEIFSRVGPADLLNLARATRTFRSVLMSRQSAFVWRLVLEAVDPEYYPPHPEDLSESAWVNLVWGGSWCTQCNRRAHKVIWEFRRRVCKDCIKNCLVLAIRYHPLARSDDGGFHPEALPVVKGRGLGAPRELWSWCFWKEDAQKLSNDLKGLRERFPDDATYKAERETFLQPFIAHRIAVHEHAELCLNLERKRSEGRSEELDSMRIQRLEQVKARLLNLGYTQGDVSDERVLEHKEARVPKPLTDRVWLRIEPVLRSIVDAVRDERLQDEHKIRVQQIQNIAAAEYVSLLRCVAPSMVSFLPSLARFYQLPWVSAALAPDREPSEEVFADVHDAVYSSLPDIERWIVSRAEQMKALIPAAWPKRLLGSEDIGSQSPAAGGYSAILSDNQGVLAPLDLAVYVYMCTRKGQSTSQGPRATYFFGLDVLAHLCASTDDDHCTHVPREREHEAALHILELLQMDPACTTPADLDALKQYFVCDTCANGIFLHVYTWRGAILHKCLSTQESVGSDPPSLNLRLLTPFEDVVVKMRTKHPLVRSASIWACSHCSAHFGETHSRRDYVRIYPRRERVVDPFDLGRWYTYSQAVKHLREEHGVADIVEGQDVFANRQRGGLSRVFHVRMWSSLSVEAGRLQRIVEELAACSRVSA